MYTTPLHSPQPRPQDPTAAALFSSLALTFSKVTNLLSPTLVPTLLFTTLLLANLFLPNALRAGDLGTSDNFITRASIDSEDLILRVDWPNALGAENLELTVVDEDDQPVATQWLWSEPGQQSWVEFNDFLLQGEDRGLQFSAVLKDAAGAERFRRAFRFQLDCTPGPCAWKIQNGLFTNALAISEPLARAWDDFGKSESLLEEILDRRPDLRGDVYSLATQLDRLDRRLGLGHGCICAWFHSFSHNPSSQICEFSPEQPPIQSGREHETIEGSGARAFAAAQVRESLHYQMASATGESRQTLELRCWRIDDWLQVADIPLMPLAGPPGGAPRLPIIKTCSASCQGSVEASASLNYLLRTSVQESAGSSPVATAFVDGSLGFNVDAHAWAPEVAQASLQFQSGTHDDFEEGTLQISTPGGFSEVQSVTATLSSGAFVAVKAQEDLAWSFAWASIWGGIRAEGDAACALLPARYAELEATQDGSHETDDCGEPQIEPWGY